MPPAQDLADAFGLGRATGLTRTARGAMGAIWRLDVADEGADEGSYAAKELFWNPPGEDRVGTEIRLVDAARAEGVRSQVAVPAPGGRYVVSLAGTSWRLYRWIDGGKPDDDATDWLVGQMARIHRVNTPGAPYVPGDEWYHRVEIDWAELAVTAQGRPWADRLAGVVPRLIELTSLVNSVPVGPGVSCHRDLQHTNVLRDRAGRNWLLDWDNHGPLEPWRELGALLIGAVPDLGRIGRLAAAYRKQAGTDVLPDGPELFATGLAVRLNFLSEQVRAVTVTHPEDGDEHLAWSARMVGQLLGPFPAVAELARAAAVVSGSRAAGPA